MKERRSAVSSRQGKPPRLTQKDISRALGLSQSTIAMALNPKHSHRLLDATVARVRAYVQKVGYVGQGGASVLDPSVKTIAIVTRVGAYASLRDMLDCLINAFNRHCVRLIVLDIDWLDNNTDRLREMLNAQPLHGVVAHSLVQVTDMDSLLQVVPAGVPVLGLQCEVPGGINLRVDMVDAFCQLTQLHLGAGVRDVALLLPRRGGGQRWRPIWMMHERVQGFVLAVLRSGGEVVADADLCEQLEVSGIRDQFSSGEVPLAARIIYPQASHPAGSAFSHGYDSCRELIAAGKLPQVLVCSNDDIAIGVLAACADHGVQVPEQLRVCGCDNTEAARFAAPGLTSIARPWLTMAEETVRTMMEFVMSGKLPAASYEKRFTAQVVVRASSGSPEHVAQRIEQLRPLGARSFVCEPRPAGDAHLYSQEAEFHQSKL